MNRQPPLRRVICARCGGAFDCGLNDPAGCWCMREPRRLPLPTSPTADCLCLDCLRAAAPIETSAG
jgi:hypothetical protein